jgi:hypothetical protein
MLSGSHPDRGTLYACVDPTAHHCSPAVRDMRLAAQLAPFTSEDAALTALKEAGAEVRR